MYEPKIRNAETDLLVKAILSLKDEEQTYRFFEDICTISEFKSMAQRIEVATLLRAGVTYQDIVKESGACPATISRVNRALQYGADGYNQVLTQLEEQKAE